MNARPAAALAMPSEAETFCARAHRVDPRGRSNYQVVDTLDQFVNLEDEWNTLFERHLARQNPFQSFAWCQNWSRIFVDGKTRRLHILTVRIEGRLVLIWPMVRERSNGLVCLRFLGTPLTQYGDVLMDPETPASVLAASWAHLKETAGVDLIEFYKVREDAAIAPLLRAVPAILTQRDSAPFVDMSGWETYDAYAATAFSKKRRANLRRVRRRFEETGPLRLETSRGGPHGAQLVDAIFDLKLDWLRKKALPSRTLADPRTRVFFRNAALEPAPSMGLRIVALWSGEELIGGEISFAAGTRLCVHIIAHSTKYERWSPGQLTTAISLEHNAGEGVSCYDFLAPDAPFKADWANGASCVNDMAVPTSWRGLLWARIYLQFARGRLKALYRKIPSSLRRVTTPAVPSLLSIAG